jgi:hypothetical protein
MLNFLKKEVILLLFFLFHSLQADIIELKNGRFIEGNFLKDSKKEIEFESNGIIKKIDKEDIKKLYIGYLGIPFCYKKKGFFETKDCSGLLFSLDEKQIIVAKGVGYVNREKISLQELKYLKVENLEQTKVLSKVLKPNIEIYIKDKTQKWDYLKIHEFKKGNFLVTDLTTQEKKQINELEIHEIEWKQKKDPFQWSDIAFYGMPGIYQFSNESYIKGFLLANVFLGLGIYAGVQQNRLNQTQPESFLIIWNGLPLTIPSPNSNAEIQSIQNSRNTALAGMGGVLFIHLLDVYWTEKTTENQIGFHLYGKQEKNFLLNQLETQVRFSLELKF